jgi:hypothetical protein
MGVNPISPSATGLQEESSGHANDDKDESPIIRAPAGGQIAILTILFRWGITLNC